MDKLNFHQSLLQSSVSNAKTHAEKKTMISMLKAIFKTLWWIEHSKQQHMIMKLSLNSDIM